MKKSQTIYSLVFGTSVIMALLFADLLEDQLWIFVTIPFAIVGIGCFFILLNSIIKRNWPATIIMITCLLISALIYLPKSELMKSKRILEATLNDDLSALQLILREDRTFELIPITWMGESEKFTGAYQIREQEIIFLDKPYANDFIPDTVLIFNDKILLNGDLANPDTSFANYFYIEFINIESLPMSP